MSSPAFTTQKFVAAAAKGAKKEEDRRFIVETWAKAADDLYNVSILVFRELMVKLLKSILDDIILKLFGIRSAIEYRVEESSVFVGPSNF
jgi:phosphopantetheine adenylyltransferase